MLLPQFERVIFEKNPLESVICQLRFPTILKIDAEQPAQFQDAIREIYPLFEFRIESASDVPPEVSQLMQQMSPAFLRNLNSKPVYVFSSEADDWTISLSSNSIALMTNKYKMWEDFEQKFKLPFEAFVSLYKPAFFERVGLRYINFIHRSRLGIDRDTSWSELLNAPIAGMLATEDFSGRLQSQEVNVIIGLDDNLGRVRMHHGLAEHKDSGEPVYLIDNDFFIESRIGVQDVFEKLTEFHLLGGKLFQWSITTYLRELLVPRPLTN